MTIPTAARMARGEPAPATEQTRARIERAIRRARLVLSGKRCGRWSRRSLLSPPSSSPLSWFGLWRLSPTAGPDRRPRARSRLRRSGSSSARSGSASRPARPRLLRVEQATGMLHRPATAFTDRLAVGADDPAAQALWIAHRERLLAALDTLKAGMPSPGLARRDPLRAPLPRHPPVHRRLHLCRAGAARAARRGLPRRRDRSQPPIARIDAWVTPPAYTGRAADLPDRRGRQAARLRIFRAGRQRRHRAHRRHQRPRRRQHRRRPARRRRRSSRPSRGAGRRPASAPAARAAGRARQGRRASSSARATARSWRGASRSSRTMRRRSPSCKPAGADRSGALALTYSLKDDYGVVVGQRRDRAARRCRRPTPRRRPLFEAPQVAAVAAAAAHPRRRAETIRDLTSHPWAGARVKMTLVARDEAEPGRPERAGRADASRAAIHQPAGARRRRAAREARASTPTRADRSPTRSTR